MKQPKLLVNPSAEPLLAKLRAALPPSLLLQGEVGVGLRQIAVQLTQNIENIIEPMTSKGEVDHLTGSISIEVIRSLYEATRGKSDRDFVIIIDDADRMTLPAQHAFLKLLEEPPRKAHFILTTHAPAKLLSTIRSRVLSYQIPRITSEQSKLYLHKAGIDTTSAAQLLFLADGRPALLTELAGNQKTREQAIALVRDGRTFVTAAPYARLALISKYAARADALKLIDTALILLKFAFKNGDKQTSRQVTLLLAAHEAISSGGNVKLHLMHTVV